MTVRHRAQVFDLTTWKLTLPMDVDGDDAVDEISVGELQSYQHPDFYYLDDDNHLVFVTPNSAFTTPNSSNARTELRQMLAGADDTLGAKAPEQNFALASHPDADRYAQIGGYLDATLRVDHVAERTDKPDRRRPTRWSSARSTPARTKRCWPRTMASATATNR